jgi:hypothetical protein
VSGFFTSVRALAEPLIASEAFGRLGRISFLGILSPRYSDLPDFPFARLSSVDDGDRAQHSLGVAVIVGQMASRLGLSAQAQLYATAWSLIHDIATWPLSHTGEAGFSRITGHSSHSLRNAMVEGADWLPRRLKVYAPLKELKIDHSVLLSLFEKSQSGLTGEFRILQKLINSPITPDTLEGMERSGHTFGIPVPDTEALITGLYRDVFSDVMIDRRASSQILQFWRAKGEIYDRHINRSSSIEFESIWSNAIEETFKRTSLVDSLDLSERQIVHQVLTNGLPRFRSVRKYKHPLSYVTAPELTRKRQLQENIRVEDLEKLLMKKERQL